jgi:adenosine deaminase CECR1
MKYCIQGKKLYPDVVCGYDFVGPEDEGRTLHDLTPELIWFQEECAREGVEIPFFFHAGECLGDGDETDQNLFDAILFGTRRIGHGFSLYKHPLLIDMVKEKQILVESCPISNEMLRYTASIMSHPLPALLSRGVASSLSNDDPAIMGQGTSGMTHDFWQALQGWDNLGLAGLVSEAFLVLEEILSEICRGLWLKTVFAGQCSKTKLTRSGSKILAKARKVPPVLARREFKNGTKSGKYFASGL